MEYRARLNSLKGRSVSFTLLDDLDYSEVKKHAVNGKIYAYIDIVEKDKITRDQRNMLFALFHDMADYTGDPYEYWEQEMKIGLMIDQHLEEYPSLQKNAMSKSLASKFIEYVFVFCIKEDIPFKHQEFYLEADVSKMLYAMTMKRICWVTGKPNADIHHAVNLVSMGGDRTKFNHLNSRFMALSREAHNEAHTMGYDEFCAKYHVSALKLSKDDLKKLGVRGKYD